jgi:glycosidase
MRWLVSKLLLLAATLLILSPDAFGQPSFATNAPWQAQSIYQVITDRFFDGDPANNNAEGNYAPRRPNGVHGGDFKGLEQKLDYIKALGATAIWISPVIQNARGQFHGYAGLDFYRVAPHWGSLADLQHLVQAAHARGLLVIDDIVVNHGGDLIGSSAPGYGRFLAPPAKYPLRYRNPAQTYPPPFDLNPTNTSLEALFHAQGAIHDFSDPAQVELGELCGLDDFRTETPYIQARMAEIYEYWIEQAGFDGFRVDTVKHVEHGFWQHWCPEIHGFAASHSRPNFFIFGEVLDTSEAKCGSYTGARAGGPYEMDSVLDYPLFFAMEQVFARGTASPKLLLEHYAAVQAHYDAAARNRLVTFLDNHDQPRLLSRSEANNNLDRLRLALVFLYTSQGVPCLYYGTEQGFDGETDPNDREDMFAGQFEQGPSLGDNFNMTHPLFLWVARLNNFRRLYAPLRLGSQINLHFDTNTPGPLAHSRRLGTNEILVMLNTADRSSVIPPLPTGYPSGTRLQNLLDTNDVITTTQTFIPALTLPALSAKIFVAESSLSREDPMVIRCSPKHDSHETSVNTEIVLEFSQPMDTRSVEATFSVDPAGPGNFRWSQDRTTLTFKPDTDLPTAQTITVHVQTSARALRSSRPLFAPFEFRFQTAESPRTTSPAGKAE